MTLLRVLLTRKRHISNMIMDTVGYINTLTEQHSPLPKWRVINIHYIMFMISCTGAAPYLSGPLLSVKESCPPFSPLLLLLFHPNYTTVFHLHLKGKYKCRAAFMYCRKYQEVLCVKVKEMCSAATWGRHHLRSVSTFTFYSVDAPAAQAATSVNLKYK